MMPVAMKNIRPVLVILALTIIGSMPLGHAEESLNYKAMVDEIGGFFNEALVQYKQENIQEAKKKAQAAYFEVFENLEGPIRINISARKNFELEEEFVAIRKMIVDREPAPAIEKRINDFMAELRSLLPELEEGIELVAEASEPAQPGDDKADIEPVWLQSFENIQSRLGKALEVYRQGDLQKAAGAVVQTQFDEYKNSLLETAVRRHVSQKKDFENNSAFSEIVELMRDKSLPGAVEARMAGLVKDLEADLPGLPLVDGAVSKKEAIRSAEAQVSDKDWSQVTTDLFTEVEKAIALYKKGETADAVGLLQDTYFDVFEASGMEAKIGARDANFKAELESHFNLLVGHMKNNSPAESLEGALTVMKSDFQKGVEMLGNGGDSPLALFFYSLMIILREGIEAILIITAIIAYLAKSGNQDKLKAIYNGVLTALALSVVTAVLVKWVFNVSAASQEIMEGITMLLAAAVLFSVSYWLISKAEAQKWVSYIKEKVSASVSSNSLKTLWFAAFLAVYREGAETVLFYQALAADAAGAGITAIAAGFVIGCILLVGVYLAMRFGAMKLPLRPFFLFTGALLFYMSFVFAGKGVMELIEGKLIEPSLITWMPKVPVVGLYPYAQTLIPQVLILGAAAAGLVIMARKKSASVEAAKND